MLCNNSTGTIVHAAASAMRSKFFEGRGGGCSQRADKTPHMVRNDIVLWASSHDTLARAARPLIARAQHRSMQTARECEVLASACSMRLVIALMIEGPDRPRR